MNETFQNKFPQSIKELENFIDCYQNKLVHHAFFRLGNKEEAEDIVQEVIIKMFNDRNKYKDLANPSSYIFRMVSNSCIDRLRMKKNIEYKNEIFLKNILNNYVDDSSAKIIEKEEFKRVNAILSRIPDEQAEVIRQRVIDEMSFTEIADILQLPATTVKSRFKYGITKLKSIIQKSKEVQNEL
ncbi:MAG TPA: RNA polymerase sigma factor [Bacteroidales bacterium]|nr:RNA polymerase sigma factor [Bacteroidales bacterium]HPS15594.1 RNA polymerase sigma factor [Bacteroidales bacterium]